MKKLLLSFLILFCLQFAPAKAQWVTIPDTNFVNKLTQLYPSCMNGNQMDTTCSEIVNETSLIVNNSNIFDLTGVEYFVNITFLSCSNNQLTTLTDLPNSLHTLYASENYIDNITFFPDSLVNIELFFNQLTSLPALPNNLTNLACSNNLLLSLPALPNTLTQLICNNNQLTNLPSLPNSLTYLNCNYNLLSSIPSNSSLNTLECRNNQIVSLPILPNTLTYLWCDNNQISNLPGLPNSLLSLSCAANLLHNLPPLPNSLTSLACGLNQLTSLPALPANITNLECWYNQLSSLPAYPNVMNVFRVSHNNIACIDLLPQVNYFGYADISNNPFTCVPNQTNYSLGLPLCMDNDPINNPNNCPGVNITGYVFTDQNNNCNYNITDLPTENIPVKLFDNQNNLLATSYTVEGVYSFASLLPDTFQIKIEDNTLPIAIACGLSNNQSVNLDSANQTISNINFPVVCDTAYDIEVHSVNTQGWVFPGQSHTLNTNVTNNETWYNIDCGSSNNTGPVTITITGPVTFIAQASAALTPTVIGNTFTYNVADFNALTPTSFGLMFLTDTTAQAGDQICVHVEINPTPMDGDTTNNVYDFCYQVVNSYDPNMKEVYPVNVLPGYDDWFTYTIHFQNTGNAPAFNIRLRDTLDANLDINSFEVLGFSHPAQISINGNILTVRFNNIMLPDSTTDYEGSMGYFQYRLKPLPNLPNGTQIENTAYIYFDYNAPIITNTTQNNFDMTVRTKDIIKEEEHYVLYPNPSAGIFMFKDNKSIKTVEVFNMMGELILSQGNAKIINLQAYPKGIYVARVNGTQVCRLVKE
jgi:hypothetical protein